MFVWFSIAVCASLGSFITAGRGMTGQPREVPVNSSEVLRAARFALVEFNKADEPFAYTIVNVTSAKMQVVAGINYILEVQLRRSGCKTAREPCVNHSDPKDLQCHFVVTEIPWKDFRVLTQTKCHLRNC